jgi:hypothetical protein
MGALITERFKTKKAMREAVEANPDNVFLEDASIFAPWYGSAQDAVEKFGEGVPVTYMPKRNWFGQLKFKKGKLTVV